MVAFTLNLYKFVGKMGPLSLMSCKVMQTVAVVNLSPSVATTVRRGGIGTVSRSIGSTTRITPVWASMEK